MRAAIGYASILLVFGAIDAVWLSVMGRVLYKPVLGDILTETVRLAPALAFYLVYPVGLLVFVVLPTFREGSLLSAFAQAMLFGAIAYATYDLTNFATLRNWTLQITAIDIAYGAVASGFAAAVAVYVLRAASRWIG
jgi:uncharacterized membrane protein